MRFRTIGLIVTLALGLLAVPLPAEAQQAGKVYRMGILRSGSPSSYIYAPKHKILRQGLRELGYIKGQQKEDIRLDQLNIFKRGKRQRKLARPL